MSVTQDRYLNLADNVLVMENGKLSMTKPDSLPPDMHEPESKNSRKNSAHEQNDNQNATDISDKFEQGMEEREVGHVKLSTIVILFQKMGWIFFLIWLVFSWGSEVIKRIFEFWMQSYIKSVNNQDPSELLFLYGNEARTLTTIIIVHVSVVMTGSIIFALNHLRAVRKLFTDFNVKVIYSKMIFFDRTPVGRIINRYSEDIFKIDNDLLFNLQIFSNNTLVFATTFIGMVIMIPWFVPAILIGVTIVYYYQDRYRQANREVQRLLLVNNSTFTNHVTESLKGIRTIRAFKKEKTFLHEFEKSLTEIIGVGFVSQALYFWACFRIGIIAYLMLFTILIICCSAVLFDYPLDYTKICLCLSYILTCLWLFESYIISIGKLEKNFLSLERIQQYFSNQTEQLEEKGPLPKETTSVDDQIVTFENVHFSYETEPTEEIKYALQDISFTIKRREKIAICGRTGSGKSSILNVLFRFYEIQKGRILLNGKQIDSMSLIDLRKQMSIIPQLGFLFKGTLRENLDPRGELDEAKIKEVIQSVGLNLKATTGNSPKEPKDEGAKESSGMAVDLNFQLENLGSNLSNGEKQMINFLRVFIHAQDLICLDEANSNIDAETDAILMKALFEICRDKTIMMISHRLENLRLFDRIIVLDHGRIVECGSFDELSDNPRSHFNVLRNNTR
eukprot:TRINITY_DN519_c0_g1_i5.p1 TRINITY_DN519_c0_g1~~TRINITY_DN519_c0_g1_i5.p1  ORF type:complete len:676 (-),score=130.61 TRINITY_DN519_c0_g1_i5:71-2098(-)